MIFYYTHRLAVSTIVIWETTDGNKCRDPPLKHQLEAQESCGRWGGRTMIN